MMTPENRLPHRPEQTEKIMAALEDHNTSAPEIGAMHRNNASAIPPIPLGIGHFMNPWLYWPAFILKYGAAGYFGYLICSGDSRWLYAAAMATWAVGGIASQVAVWRASERLVLEARRR